MEQLQKIRDLIATERSSRLDGSNKNHKLELPEQSTVSTRVPAPQSSNPHGLTQQAGDGERQQSNPPSAAMVMLGFNLTFPTPSVLTEEL